MTNRKIKFNRKFFRKKHIFLSILSLFLILCGFNYWGNDNISPSCTAVTLAADSNPKVQIRNDGTTMVNGKPFFPFGLYHVSWNSTATEQKNDLQNIAAAGFNTVHASANNLKDYGEFLDEAERLGVYVLSEQKLGLLNLVNAFKHKSAVLGWNIADDVDNGKLTTNDVWKSHQSVKASDSNHVTYISGYSENIGKFARCADAIGMQSYPIKTGTEKELSLTYSTVAIARDAATKFEGAVYANLQAFSWYAQDNAKYPEARAPTFAEVRNMTYQALLAGAKGIIYYTYRDELWYLPDSSDLWQGLKSLVLEIKTIESILLSGKFTTIETNDSEILAGMWTYQNTGLAVAINRSYDRPLQVDLALSDGVSEAQPIFRTPAGVAVANGKLSSWLKPLEVNIYRLVISS